MVKAHSGRLAAVKPKAVFAPSDQFPVSPLSDDLRRSPTNVKSVIKPPSCAVEILPDSDRYKCRFKVRSESSDKNYLIAFDSAPGAGYWKCSCFGNIRHGDCKHLRAAGLRGRAYGRDLATLRALGYA